MKNLLARLPRKAAVLGPIGIVVIVLAVLVIGVVTGGSGSSKPVADRSGAPSHRPTGPAAPAADPALSRGPSSAPVTIVEFGDYQCPGCGRFFHRTETYLFNKYVDKGVVRFQWRDFPWIGKQSITAAVAARAAGKQGKFWQFHNALYAHQFPKKSGKLTDGYLAGIAQRLGLDMGRFNADRRDPALRSAVQADYAYGQRLGATGTPDFVINGRRFFGEQPLSAFEQAIDQARQRT